MRSASPGDSGRSSRSPGASRPSTRASSASAGRAVAVPVSPDVPEKGEATGASTPARRAHERILRPPALPLISWHPAKGIRTGDASSSSPYEAPLNTLKHLSSILEACAARPETSKRRPAHTSPPSVHRPLHDLRNCADARALQYPSPSAASLGSSTRPLLLLVAFVVFLATCAVFLRGKPLLSHVGSAKTLYDVSSEFHRSDNNAMKASRRPCACVCGVAACAHACPVILRMKTLMPTAPGPTREHVRDRATVPTTARSELSQRCQASAASTRARPSPTGAPRARAIANPEAQPTERSHGRQLMCKPGTSGSVHRPLRAHAQYGSERARPHRGARGRASPPRALRPAKRGSRSIESVFCKGCVVAGGRRLT